jgi:outer membrane protein OmpA-like peptidoglycan-associated protein
MDVVGRALNADKLAPFKFSIEGHADPRGGTELNQRLSEERAQSVRQYLVENHHIDPQRLTSVGKGDKEPLNEKDPAAPENRRVTIVTITP